MARKRKPEDIIGKLREAEIVIAMADLWFRYAPSAASHGAGDNQALANNADHSAVAGQKVA